MFRIRLILVAATLVFTGCTTAGTSDGPTGTEAPSRAATSRPSFELTLDGATVLPTYASDRAAALDSCEPAKAGGWTYLYAGGSPFVSVDLSVYSGAVDGRAPSDFDLDIGAPTGQVRLVPSGRREGAKGTGTAVIEKRNQAVVVTVRGSAATMVDGSNAGVTDVQLTLTCPR